MLKWRKFITLSSYSFTFISIYLSLISPAIWLINIQPLYSYFTMLSIDGVAAITYQSKLLMVSWNISTFYPFPNYLYLCSDNYLNDNKYEVPIAGAKVQMLSESTIFGGHFVFWGTIFFEGMAAGSQDLLACKISSL